MKIGVIVDMMGSIMGPADAEYAEHAAHFGGLWPGSTVYRAMHPGEGEHGIRSGTDVVVYDYGGMMPGAEGLLVSNARSLNSDWVERAIDCAERRSCGVHEYLYVGLDKNFQQDTGNWYYSFVQIGKRAGIDEEGVWSYRP